MPKKKVVPADREMYEFTYRKKMCERPLNGPLRKYPNESQWVRAWCKKFLEAPVLVRNAMWIAERSTKEQLDLFVPFIRLVMKRYPAPGKRALTA